MKLYQTLILTALVPILVATLAACSGGSGRRIAGKLCKQNAKPIALEIVGDQKAVDMKPGAKEMPAGTYAYNGSSVYYVSGKDVRIHVVDAKQNNGTFKSGIECVRNAHLGTENIAVDSEGLKTMSVDAGFNVNGESMHLAFDTSQSKIVVSTKAGQKGLNSPELAYKDTKVLKVVMIKTGANTYDIRSEAADAQGGKYWSSVSLIRTDLPKAANAPAVTPAPEQKAKIPAVPAEQSAAVESQSAG